MVGSGRIITPTIRDLIDAVKHALGSGDGRPSTHDEKYPNRLIWYYFQMALNRIRYNSKIGKLRDGFDSAVTQTLPCVDLIAMDMASGECPCAPAKGCDWLRTKIPVPRMIEGQPRVVATLDGSVVFDYVKWSQFEQFAHSRLPGVRNGAYFTIRLNKYEQPHVYLYGNHKVTEAALLSRIAVEANFSDAEEVYAYPICGKAPDAECNILDRPFHIEEELRQDCVMMATQLLLGLEIGKPADIGNDSVNTSAPIQPPLDG